MSSVAKTEQPLDSPHASPLATWSLLIGGAFFFVGGSLHPKEDPPGVALKEHLHVMFEDPLWYPAHAVTLIGIALIAASLVLLVRGHGLGRKAGAHLVAAVAAVSAVAASVGMLLHLLAALDSARIAADESTPLVDVNLVVETVTLPAFGFSIAALALTGAITHSLGYWTAVPFAVIGGVGFGLAGGTALFTDKLDSLFPLAAGIAVWAIATGIWLARRTRGLRVD
jgi:hypothetical protein